MQLVDGRERSDGHDEVSLSWATRTTYSARPWDLWYGIIGGDVKVAQPPDVHQ